MYSIMKSTRQAMKSGRSKKEEAKTGKNVETVLEEESDDDLPDLAAKTSSDEEDDVVAAAKDGGAIAADLKAADRARKLLFVFVYSS